MSGAGLTPVPTHLARVLELGPLGEVVTVRAVDVVGRQLAETLTAPADLPAFTSSALDGYAVRADDVPGRLSVTGEIAAGSPLRRTVVPGTALRIMTGGPIPAGADAVVGVEGTDGGLDTVLVHAAVTPGTAVRPAGSDVRAGNTVAVAGQRIGPAQLAALLSTGHHEVAVRRRPRVLVVSTGDELVDPGSTVGPAQLVDSNRPALLAAVALAGAEPVDGGRSGDDPARLLSVLAASADVDLVLTSGGISMGAYDVVKLALRDRGVQFDRVAMQPGMPQAWGRVELAGGRRVPFVGLPGNPVSALVSFAVFVRPLLGRPAPRRWAALAGPVSGSPVDKRQFLRGRLEADGRARVAGAAGSHLLVSLAAADVLIVIPEGVSQMAADSAVEVIELDPTWT